MSGIPSLFRACQTGDVSVVEVYASLNFAGPKVANNSASALYIACCEGHLEIVQILLRSQQFDVNNTNYKGYSPIYAASRKNYADIVEVLLTDPKLNMTSYEWADLNFSRDVMYLLVQHKTFDKWRTFLNDAIEKKDVTLLQVIFQHQDVNPMSLFERVAFQERNPSAIFDAILSHPKLDTDLLSHVLCTMIEKSSYYCYLWKHIRKVMIRFPCLTPNKPDKHGHTLLMSSDQSHQIRYEMLLHREWRKSRDMQLNMLRTPALTERYHEIERSLFNYKGYKKYSHQEMLSHVNEFTKAKLDPYFVRPTDLKVVMGCYSYIQELVYTYEIALRNKVPHEIYLVLIQYFKNFINE